MRPRILIAIVSLAVGQAIAFAIGMVRMPDAPLAVHVFVGLLAGGIMGYSIDRLRTLQFEAFTAARSGNLGRVRTILERRTAGGPWGGADAFGTAVLEVALGRVQDACTRLARDPAPRFGPAAAMRACIERHADVLSPNAGVRGAALAPLLDAKRMRAPETEVYRAYLIARAALEPHPPELVARAIRLLGSHRERDARAYAQWVRAWHELPLDDRDRLSDARRAAELAREHDAMELLAQRVDARASAIEREAAAVGPYRR